MILDEIRDLEYKKTGNDIKLYINVEEKDKSPFWYTLDISQSYKEALYEDLFVIGEIEDNNFSYRIKDGFFNKGVFNKIDISDFKEENFVKRCNLLRYNVLNDTFNHNRDSFKEQDGDKEPSQALKELILSHVKEDINSFKRLEESIISEEYVIENDYILCRIKVMTIAEDFEIESDKATIFSMSKNFYKKKARENAIDQLWSLFLKGEVK